MDVLVSLKTEPRGYAQYLILGEMGKLILYLNSIKEIPLGVSWSPFRNIEEVIEELVIHEKIHEITYIEDDEIIDRWHTLLCRLLNQRKVCDCPIDCFWRNVYELKP